MKTFRQFGNFLQARPHSVLIAVLGVLHLTLLTGVDTAVGPMCWLVDVGLFIIWQPFIQTGRRLDASALLLLVLALAGGAWLFGWWLLILWVILLTALLGGRLFMLGHRRTRLGHLLAFAYLICALLIFLLPKIVPGAAANGPSLDQPFLWVSPLLFLAMIPMAQPRETRLPEASITDLFHSFFIFLLISVLVLGSLAFMQVRQSSHIEAVFNTLVTMAAMLLLIAWAWSPRRGFGGVGLLASRYLLAAGLPFETWLKGLMACAKKEPDPERFLRLLARRLLEQPWVSGCGWSSAPGANAGEGFVGEVSPFRHDFECPPLRLTLYGRRKPSPALVWHFNLLSQLTTEYYLTKQRARELQQMSYLRAMHETGARLTHDVKNLLQSLNNLCFMPLLPGARDEAAMIRMMQRQLPLIAQRLQETLAQLQVPRIASGEAARDGESVSAERWWDGLQERYASNGIEFAPTPFAEDARLPLRLFDSVADNLLQNALAKRREDAGLRVSCSLSADGDLLRVCDDGRPVREEVVAALFGGPVDSERGFGVGLYHAARQAEGCGYELRLANNAAGRVCFELKRQGSGDGRCGFAGRPTC